MTKAERRVEALNMFAPIFWCPHYMPKDGEPRRVRVVLVPAAVVEDEQKGKVILDWGCSHGPSCGYQACRYSRRKPDVGHTG